MSKEKSGNINSDEEYGLEDELITHELAGLDLNSSGSKSSPSPTVVRSTPRNTPVRASSTGSKGSQSGSVSSKETTPPRTNSNLGNIKKDTSFQSLSGQSRSSSQNELEDVDYFPIGVQDDRFAESNRRVDQMLNQSLRPESSLGFNPNMDLDNFDPRATDFSGSAFTRSRDKGSSLATIFSESDSESAVSSRAPSRFGSSASLATSLSLTPKAENKKHIPEKIPESSTFSSLNKISGKRKGRSSPVQLYKPLPQTSGVDELNDDIFEIWGKLKEEYRENLEEVNRLTRESRKKKAKVEAAGAGDDMDEEFDEEADRDYRQLLRTAAAEVHNIASTGIITTGIVHEWLQFWLDLYYNINTNFEYRQSLIRLLENVRDQIGHIGNTSTFELGKDDSERRSLIIFLPTIDMILDEVRSEQNFYSKMDYVEDKKKKGGMKKRKTRKRKSSKGRKTSKRKAARKIKLTRKKKATTKKRKFIKTKRSLKTNKKIRTCKR